MEQTRNRPDGMREQISLQLKTKTLGRDCCDAVDVGIDEHVKTDHADVDADRNAKKEGVEDEITCSICIVPLENGERVGDLTCGHHFHVDCLKTWVCGVLCVHSAMHLISLVRVSPWFRERELVSLG